MLDDLAKKVGRGAGRLKREFDRTIGRTERPHIVSYRGYGNRDHAYISGRVLRDPAITRARADDAWWLNLINTYKRVESDEVPGARVRIEYCGNSTQVTADDEGYFRAVLPAPSSPQHFLWQPVELELLEPEPEVGSESRTIGQVLVPAADAQFGVISDLDDTVIRTEVTSLLRMLKTVILKNAATRLPFPGVAAFYQALQNGRSGTDPVNPIFYVSSSPWNLYDLLEEFLLIQKIPVGPLILRDWGLGVHPGRSAKHKTEAIAHIFEAIPSLPFILIGDSGQEDPEIYREVVHRYPGRVKAIYIRNVTPHAERSASIRKLIDEVTAAGTAMLLTDNTLTAARHAADQGWIHPQALEVVAADTAADRGNTEEKAP